MSNLQKSKRFDLIDKFNDTSRYLDDIFTIDNRAFAEHIPDIYPRELQLKKANTSDKEASFLDLNIKVIRNNIHTSVYDKRDDFGFPIINFPWLNGDVPRLPSYGIYISHTTGYGKRLESSLGHTLNFSPNLVQYHFKNMYPKESLTRSSTVILSTSKKGQRQNEFHLVGLKNSETPSTSSVWPSDHREDYRSFALPFYSLVQIIP